MLPTAAGSLSVIIIKELYKWKNSIIYRNLDFLVFSSTQQFHKVRRDVENVVTNAGVLSLTQTASSWTFISETWCLFSHSIYHKL